jgi:hypothetical protein
VAFKPWWLRINTFDILSMSFSPNPKFRKYSNAAFETLASILFLNLKYGQEMNGG